MEKKQQVEPVKKEKPNKQIIITFRLFQALCFGIFALGLAMIAGDYSTFVKSPISTLSIMTTLFGLLGSIISGILAKQAANW